MVNDLNPLLSQKSNDEGYTLGIYHEVRICNKKSQRYYDISLSSNLYTMYMHDEAYFLGARKIIPQKFTELNTLKLSINRFVERKNLFSSIQFGLGVRNKEKPIKGFSLYYSGGSDGLGGYHGYLYNSSGDQHGAEIISTGGIEPFVYVAPSLIKYFAYKSNKKNKDVFFLKLQSGFSIGTSQIESTIFSKYYGEWPLVKINGYKQSPFMMSAIVKGDIVAHSSGVLYNPEFGIEISIFFVRMGYLTIFHLGNYQESVVSYYDNESHMRAYLRIDL